jgi:Raf kinase inhibitor-like YbhB/YbcL family protein
MALEISSPSFAGAAIPARFTCQGENISPALAWRGAPDTTRSYALILEDPDAPAGLFTHWIIFNMPASTVSLPEGVSPRGRRPAGSVEGKNDMGMAGYSGPCPPPGSTHRYYFKLYALSDVLPLKSGASRKDTLDALEGLIVDKAQVMGTFRRG